MSNSVYLLIKKTGLSVQVQFDGGSWTEATGSNNWKLMVPTGSNTWQGNSKYTISVPAIESDGANSDNTVILTVRKGINRDINGDGYADLVILDSAYNPLTVYDAANICGRIYLFNGSCSNITSSTADNADVIFSGTGTSFTAPVLFKY